MIYTVLIVQILSITTLLILQILYFRKSIFLQIIPAFVAATLIYSIIRRKHAYVWPTIALSVGSIYTCENLLLANCFNFVFQLLHNSCLKNNTKCRKLGPNLKTVFLCSKNALRIQQIVDAMSNSPNNLTVTYNIFSVFISFCHSIWRSYFCSTIFSNLLISSWCLTGLSTVSHFR